MTHKKIIRRQINGIIGDDSDIPRMRQHFENLLINYAMDDGLIQHLDINPEFSLQYINGSWDFLLTIHFVKVGKKEAYKWQGISEGRLLAKPTHPSM